MELSFVVRLGLLATFLGGLSLWDYARNAGSVRKARESGFLLLVALVGGVLGGANDVVTATISPEYFELGKGIAGGDGLRLRAAQLGFEAGFGAAALSACVLLFANNPGRQPSLSYRHMSSIAASPPAFAIAGALVGAGIAYFFASTVESHIPVPLSSADARSFGVAWGIHAGMYFGLVVGVIGAFRRIRWRRRTATNESGWSEALAVVPTASRSAF